MEVPDILPWRKPDELLTTGYPLRESPGGRVGGGEISLATPRR